jgi:hypothetical protein
MPDENFSNDPEEQLRIENELLRIQLKAQFGNNFLVESNGALPPEIENQFLKNVLAFEDHHNGSAYTRIFDKIGKPEVKNYKEMKPGEISLEVERLLTLLQKHGIQLQFSAGPYPAETIYPFITEEFFEEMVEERSVPGMTDIFLYEEFHPNHQADITNRAHEFIRNWVQRNLNEYSTELSWHCINQEGVQMTREDVINRLKIFFEAFEYFGNDGYNIDEVSFQLQEEGTRGMGFAEGKLKYDAIMENGETIHYEGPYKLYMQLEDNWWCIFNFIMPGFKC